MPTGKELKEQYQASLQPSVVSSDVEEDASSRVTNNNLIIEALKNAPSSAVQFGKDIVSPILSPIQTAKSIGELSKSVVALVKPGEQGNEDLARQVGQFYVERYGSLENIKRTLSQDPVGALGDLALVFSGAGGVAKLGKATTVAEKAAKASKLVDPLTPAAFLAKGAVDVPGKVARQVVGTATGVGAQPYRQALLGGEQFTSAMRGNVTETTIVNKAREGLTALRDERRNAFQEGEAAQFPILRSVKVDSDTKSKINNLVKAYRDKAKGKSKISAITPSGEVDKVLQSMESILKQADQADDVTDLSNLVQQINEVGEGLDWTKGSQSAAFSAVKKDLENIIAGIDGVPKGYKQYVKTYSQQTDEINRILRELGLGEKKSTQAAFNKLSRAIRNPKSALGETLELLPKKQVDELQELVSGYLLSEALPPGLSRSITAGLVGTGTIGGAIPLTALPALGLVSPRLTGEATRAIGQARRGIGAVTPSRTTAGLLRQVGAQQEEMERQGLL